MPGKEWTIPKERWNKKEILLVFARAPEPGRVKTRLAKDLGPEKALALYRCFVEKTLSTARDWARAGDQGPGLAREIWICYTPEDRADLVRDWLGRDYTFLAQTGSGLGSSMTAAMKAAFDRGASKAVLVGTDIPDMEPAHLTAAFEALDRTDLVWGPSRDGGFWLVGVTDPAPLNGIFRGIPWGSDQVFTETLQNCRKRNLSWTALSPLQDVDTVPDLKQTRFYEQNQKRLFPLMTSAGAT